RFVLRQLYELVVGLDGLERLHENGLARGAGAVDDAMYAAAMFGTHRNDKAVIAHRDVVFARFRISRAEDLLERFLDGFARLGNAGANSFQRRRRIIADFAVWQEA